MGDRARSLLCRLFMGWFLCISEHVSVLYVVWWSIWEMVVCGLLLGNTALSESSEGALLERGRREKGERKKRGSASDV